MKWALLSVIVWFWLVTESFGACLTAAGSHFATSNTGDIDAALSSGGRYYVGASDGATEKTVWQFNYPPTNPTTIDGVGWYEGDPSDGATSTSGNTGWELTCGCAPNGTELHNIVVGAAVQVTDAALGTESLSNEFTFTGLTCANRGVKTLGNGTIVGVPCWVFAGRTNDVQNDVPGNITLVSLCVD